MRDGCVAHLLLVDCTIDLAGCAHVHSNALARAIDCVANNNRPITMRLCADKSGPNGYSILRMLRLKNGRPRTALRGRHGGSPEGAVAAAVHFLDVRSVPAKRPARIAMRS